MLDFLWAHDWRVSRRVRVARGAGEARCDGTSNFAKLAATAIFAASIPAGQALAQSNAIEEIVVTARKKDETITDLPASVAVLGGGEMQTRGVLDIELLATAIPNFSYTTNVGASDNLFIRGIGTVGAGPQFEPAVGQVINGVAFSRSRIGRAGLIDTAQVEVLRGPQGAVTGRNTSLGLVNIVPNKPTDEFEASVFGSVDFEAVEGFQLEGVLSGPISDSVRGRLAVNFKDQDGLLDNINPAVGGTSQTKDDFTVRGILDFDLGDRTNVELLGQFVDASRDGKSREIIDCVDPAAFLAAIGDDCELNRTHVNQATFAGTDIAETFEIEMTFLTGTINFDVTDSIVLTSITSFTDTTISDVVDTDLSNRERFLLANAEEFSQFTQEVRFSGDISPELGFILGGIYTDYEVDFYQSSDANFTANAGRRHQISQQRNEAISVFGDLTYAATDTVDISGGVRIIREDRAGRAGQVLSDLYSFSNERGACGGGSGLFGCRFFPDIPEFAAGTVFAGLPAPTGTFTSVPSFAGGPFFETDDDDVTWNVNAKWRPTDNSLYYVSAATGFKAGAFNLLALNPDNALNALNFSADPETSTNLELGGRHTVDFDSARLNFNWTLYQLEVQDQQLSNLDPVTVVQSVVNAGEARSRGFEVDGSIVSDTTTFGYSLAYTDAEYTDFPLGTCYVGQTVQAAPASGSFAIGELGSGLCGPTLVNGTVVNVQNRTGTTLVQAPEWQANVNLQRDFAVGENLVLTPFIELQFVGEHFTDTELRPESENSDFTLVNARLTLADSDGKWNVALVGQNLSDETYITFYNESGQLTPLSGGSFGFPNIGRQVALRARFNF
ncbi:MAG: TonB-dependent receptor [Pseudomonadota bacterium]